MASMMKDKVIAITGGASGMGLALAKVLVSEGAKVSICDISKASLDQATTDIRSLTIFENVLKCLVDVREPLQIQAWLNRTIETFGHIDGAANIAGVFDIVPSGQLFEDQDMEQWSWCQNVNLTGLANCLKAELKIMNPDNGGKGGSIVNVSSISGVRGGWVSAAYTASKHGVTGLTKHVSKEYGPKRIRINAVAPGVIDTPMLQKAEGAMENGRGIFDQVVQGLPIQRRAEPGEVAKVMRFLLSGESSFVTGAIWSVDGGINT